MMQFNEWFKKYEVDLNKEFADRNGEMFIKFCKIAYQDNTQTYGNVDYSKCKVKVNR